MFAIANELNTQILDFLAKEDNAQMPEFWNEYFTKNVLIQINTKMYFSKYVLSYIDKGFRLSSKTTMPCETCYLSGHEEKNADCMNCNLDSPCLNCYWYNDTISPCYCSRELIHVSWDEVKPFIRNGQKYNRYYDFVRGSEWKDLLEQEEQTLYQMDMYLNGM
jgi:hypothetical protein